MSLNSTTASRREGLGAVDEAERLIGIDAAAALGQIEALFAQNPTPRLFRLAAAACRKLGRDRDAQNAEMGGIEAGLSDPALQAAAAAGADDRPQQSLDLAEQFLAAQPGDLLALTIAADAATKLWLLERAESYLRDVLDRAPRFSRASLLLAACLARQVRVRDAIDVLERALAERPDHAPTLALLAEFRSQVRDNDKAVELFERIVSLTGGRIESWVNLSQHYRIVGKRDQSVAALREALKIDPQNGSAWWTLANYFGSQVSTEDEAAILSAIEVTGDKPEGAALHLAAGLIADRRGEHRKAFDHFTTGKRIRSESQPYEPEPISTAVDGVIERLSDSFYRDRSKAGFDDPSPIFIVGMPRSGTTLVERMLGRHADVEGVGELQIMPRLAEAARRQTEDLDHYADMLSALSDKQLHWVGRRYVEASRDYRHDDTSRFIDKANLNWMQIGLILLALPGAKIIDVRRDAQDCCWANFKMLFNAGFPAANDLGHLGRFYSDYCRLLDAMATAAPGRILPVRYEDVVDGIETETRRMLDFLELEFDPRCIDFHLATGAVPTASSEQVRRPLNREGIGSSAPYSEWLQPLHEALNHSPNR